MNNKKLELDCEYDCGKKVNWSVCDDDGENCTVASAVVCSYCGKLNLNKGKAKALLSQRDTTPGAIIKTGEASKIVEQMQKEIKKANQ